MELIAVACDIRSLHNVGSIFRTADSLGVKKLYLCGNTGHPQPNEPWRTDHQRLLKTSLGAEKSVVWQYEPKAQITLASLTEQGYRLIALETSSSAIPLAECTIQADKIALIVGNEVAGLDEDVLRLADQIVKIPMLGAKESLNVSVAFGIAAFWLLNR